jgi:2',3'-cyclic-nucleotide 2'-phosphodiesterase/3'-nucleotidase
VLIDNGDLYQGTPVSSYHIAQLTQYLSSGSTSGLNANFVNGGVFNTITPMALCLKYMGYDAAVLGNHEFNYDWDAMECIYDYLE